jgi:hypothetical protein
VPDLQHPVPFNISANALATDPVSADRFVFTPTFVLYDPYAGKQEVHLPTYQLDRAAFYVVLAKEETVKKKLLNRYTGLEDRVEEISELEEELEQAATALDGVHPQSASYAASAAGPLDALGGEIDRAVEDISASVASGALGAVGEIVARVVAATAAATSAASGGYHAASPVTTTPASTTTTTTTSQPPPGGTPLPGGGPAVATTVPPDEALLALLQSELGFLFLDRTRVRPLGFALGEHVYSLSLGPGEEVTIEERTYSKKEESFERSSEQEKTFDTEMSATLTTELNEGMNAERSTNSTDVNSMGANIGGDILGITFNIGPVSSSNLVEADRNSVNHSVKNSQVASGKVAARNRSQHKTVFRVATETRFETTNKRIIRNPNTTTPIDLEYFKVMQRLRLSHERYGVRLCWAPVVPDPGARFLARLARVKAEIYAKVALAGAGPRPEQPVPKAPVSNAPAARVISSSVIADKFDPIWGNQRFDYRVNIAAPAGMVWDRNAGAVTNSLVFTFTGSRPAGAFVDLVLPTPTGVLIVVHVGIEDNANPFKPAFWEARGTAAFTVSARFEPLAAPVATVDETYTKAMEVWREAVATWEAADREAKAEAKRAADEEWAAFLQEALRNTSPKQEVIGAIVQLFPTKYRDEIAEIDFWEDVFDWKNAGLRLYPSWWSNKEIADPRSSPDAFINASWARLYLPIRPGAEARALYWIYDHAMTGKGSPLTRRLVAMVEKELQKYRKGNFGSPDELQIGTTTGDCPPITEKFICLGRWEETLPTDGTHLEVIQATSSAADDYSRDQLDDADVLRDEQIGRAQRENALLDAAENQGLTSLDAQLDINLGDVESD